jgi:hypothetical protein
MNLDLAVKVVAWAMFVTPVTVFTIVSFYMMAGAAEDDDAIKGLIMLGLGIFVIGGALLAMYYLANFSVSWIGV